MYGSTIGVIKGDTRGLNHESSGNQQFREFKA